MVSVTTVQNRGRSGGGAIQNSRTRTGRANGRTDEFSERRFVSCVTFEFSPSQRMFSFAVFIRQLLRLVLPPRPKLLH